MRCRWAALFRCGRCLEKCLDTSWWTSRLSITFPCRVSFGGFIRFRFFVMTNSSSFRSSHIYQLFYSQAFSYYVCAYCVIFPFNKFKIQTKILSLALIRRWLMKFSFKAINEKRRVITIYIFLPHNKFYLFKYNTCNTWGTCVMIWLKRVRGIRRFGNLGIGIGMGIGIAKKIFFLAKFLFLPFEISYEENIYRAVLFKYPCTPTWEFQPLFRAVIL